MGKIYSYTYISLDGVAESPETWISPFFSPEIGADLTQRLDAAHAMVLGRQTYSEFASFWPCQNDTVPFANKNNTVRKYVVSRNLTKADWQNSFVIRNASELEDVKFSGDLHVTGSTNLVRSLMREKLLDEIVVVVCPLVLGVGKRLFDHSENKTLQLQEVVRFPRDVLRLTYHMN